MPIGAFKLNTISSAGGGAPIGWLMYNTGARASNITPGGFDVDSSGNIYILDMYSSKLAKLDSTGAIQWQKYVSTPSATTSKGDGGLLCLSPNETYVYCFLQESSTSMSLCQFNTSNGTLANKQVISASTNVYIGNIHTSASYCYVCFGVTVGTTNRMVYRRYTGGNSALSTATFTAYHLASGASAVYDCRLSPDIVGSPTNLMFGYENYVGLYTSTGTHTTTKSFTGGFDSIAKSSSGAAGFIMRNNIITKYNSLSTPTKAWEYTHTISGVGGNHYYQQGMLADANDNTYACYWNSTSGKIVIYKINTNGVLQWTKSLTLTNYTADAPDAMTMKIVGTDLYLAFKYGSISAGGMGILKIPTNGTGTKTFDNSFVLADETGTLTSSTNFSLTANSPATISVTIGTTGSAFTLSNATLPTYTKSNI